MRSNSARLSRANATYSAASAATRSGTSRPVSSGRLQPVAELAVGARGERGEQPARVAEVVLRGGLRHSRPPRGLAHAEPGDAALGQHLQPAVEQRRAQVAVVVAVAGRWLVG